MRRCVLCLYPDTKPDLPFEDGVCRACRNYHKRPEIDWDQRRKELENILSDAKRGSEYDCVVPSSGGKDSTWQTLTLIDMGVRPLVVTASTDFLTPMGRANIDNLARYATTIEVTPQRFVRARLCRLGLELVGDVCWPEHASIFSTPFRIAEELGIPYIFYGENPQREYGGPLGAEEAAEMTARWRSEFGGFLGLRPSDFVGKMGITEKDMQDYELGPVSAKAFFLGQFIEWDSERNWKVAEKAGLKVGVPCVANWWAAENLDNALTGLHDHGMYRKYGYGRGCAQISVDIRRGKVTRAQALEWVKTFDGLFPWNYAGIGFGEVLEFLGMKVGEMFTALDSHTNWALFQDRDIDTRAGSPTLRC